MHEVYSSRFDGHISSTARASVAGPFQRLGIPRAHGLLSKVGRFGSTNVDFSYGKGQRVPCFPFSFFAGGENAEAQ